MDSPPQIAFDVYRLDPLNACLWRGGEPIAVTPKAFAVLSCLVERVGQLRTKEELLAAVWSDDLVSDASLTVCIRAIRKALGDQPKSPRFIETVHRRGYRFIATTTLVEPPAGETCQPLRPAVTPVVNDRMRKRHTRTTRSGIERRVAISPVNRMVGRETELHRLQELWDRACAGERQVVFVTGEPGIGKTTLVNAFMSRVATDPQPWIASGECCECYGAGEAFRPVLEAVGQLGRRPEGQSLMRLMAQYAPSWLAHMPSQAQTAGLPLVIKETFGGASERMLREMTDALETITLETPLVLVLDDLHWSDYATLDLITSLARQHGPARLMVIGTYRPADLISSGHPLKPAKQELQAHRLCQEFPLEFLAEADVAEYLTRRLPKQKLSATLAERIYRRTDGNPLFMVNLVDYLAAQKSLSDDVDLSEIVPEGLRPLLDRQIERLPPCKSQVLEAASIAGVEFSTAQVADALAEPAAQVDDACEQLARCDQLLQPAGVTEEPDGTVTAHYRFRHALYRTHCFGRVSPIRRVELQRRLRGPRECGGIGSVA